MGALKAYLRLTRPANIVTSLSDVLLGFAASGVAYKVVTFPEFRLTFNYSYELLILLASSGCLYAGGVVLNDFFDADTDRKERPERPIPSGKASPMGALILGCLLTATGMGIPFLVSTLSGVIAVAIAQFSVLYNKYTKDTSWGPFNMGLCRACNLLLGMSLASAAIQELWFLMLIPLVYISAITIISRGEVNEVGKRTIESGVLLYLLLIIGILNLTFLDKFRMVYCLPFLLLFLIFTFPSILLALKNPEPLTVRKAVKRSILALIVLDASLASGFAGIETGIAILILLPLSLALAKGFAVT